MGIFKKKKKDAARPLDFPKGFEPVNQRNPEDRAQQEDVNYATTFTPQMREMMGIPPEDLDSYLDAMYARQLGLNEDEAILAWGPVYVGPPTADREIERGTAAVTEKSLIIWWMPSYGPFHFMHVAHESIYRLEIEGPTATQFFWKEGIYADDTGKHLVSNPNIYLAARFENQNGHNNRRALSLYHTLAHYVKQQGIG